MELEQPDPALRAANLALTGRRVERAASRFASIELRSVDSSLPSSRTNLAWEMAAVCSIGGAAVLAVIALWLFN